MSQLKIRPVTLEDIDDLQRWDNEPHVKNATSDSGEIAFDAEWEDELALRADGTEFFIAELDKRPIGMMQIIDPARERTHYWGAIAENLRAIDIWIGEVDALGHGHGTKMMNWAIGHCFEPPKVTAILIDPLAKNTDAHRFYKRLGFKFVERRQFDEESDCFVFRLERDEWRKRR